MTNSQSTPEAVVWVAIDVAKDRHEALVEQRRNSPVAVAPAFTGQCDDRFRQRIFVDLRDRGIALCPSPLPQQPAGMALAQNMTFKEHAKIAEG